MIIVIATMALIGLAVWRTVQRQEFGDEELKKSLDSDDQRARKGREEAAGFAKRVRDNHGPSGGPPNQCP